MISFFLGYTCLDENVSKMCLPLTSYNAIKLFCLRFKYNDVFLRCISILITYSIRILYKMF